MAKIQNGATSSEATSTAEDVQAAIEDEAVFEDDDDEDIEVDVSDLVVSCEDS